MMFWYTAERRSTEHLLFTLPFKCRYASKRITRYSLFIRPFPGVFLKVFGGCFDEAEQITQRPFTGLQACVVGFLNIFFTCL